MATYGVNGIKPAFSVRLTGSEGYSTYGVDLGTDLQEASMLIRLNWKPKTNRAHAYIRMYTEVSGGTVFNTKYNYTNFWLTNTDNGGYNLSNNLHYLSTYYGTSNSATAPHCTDLILHNYRRDGKLWPQILMHSDYTYSAANNTGLQPISEFRSTRLYNADATAVVKRITFTVDNSATYDDFDLLIYPDGGLLHG